MNEETLTKIMGSRDLPKFLLRCRNDFKFFCDNVLYELFKQEDGGLKPYMEEWFESAETNNRIVVFAPSGFAKTTVLGIAYPIWLAFNNKNLQIMVVSNTMPQARRVLSIMKSTIETNPLLSELKPTDYRETWSANIIKTTSKCRIFTRPFSVNVKGERVDYVIMDEADSYVRPEIFFDYIIPRLNPNGKIFLISTPESAMGLMTMIEERKLGYVIKRYTAITQKSAIKYKEWDRKWENAKAIWPERFPISVLKKISEEQGNQYFEKNFMCNILTEGENSVFTAASIQDCKDFKKGFTDSTKGGEVYIGVDLATATGPRADFDAYVVVERLEDKAIIRYAETHRGLPVSIKVNKLLALNKKFKPHMIICDKSGVGPSVIEELRMGGAPTEAQVFSSNEKAILIANLKALLDNRKLVIPKYKEDLLAVKFANTLEVELLSFKEKKSEFGGTSYVSTGAHDDTVDALAMAVKKIRQHRVTGDHIAVR